MRLLRIMYRLAENKADCIISTEIHARDEHRFKIQAKISGR